MLEASHPPCSHPSRLDSQLASVSTGSTGSIGSGFIVVI
jgi:hypothetical protein